MKGQGNHSRYGQNYIFGSINPFKCTRCQPLFNPLGSTRDFRVAPHVMHVHLESSDCKNVRVATCNRLENTVID